MQAANRDDRPVASTVCQGPDGMATSPQPAKFAGEPCDSRGTAMLNGYAALPLVSGLIEQGVSPGAGLAFLVAGGVTSLPAAIAVFALVNRPVFGLYIAFALIGSLSSGLLYQAWLS